MLDVISIGNANIDLIINNDKLSEKNEFIVKPGGSACNFAVGCSRLGLKSGFKGFVGIDTFSELIIENLKKEKVKPLIIQVKEHTGFVVIFTKKRFKQFYKFRGANQHLETIKKIPEARHVHLATPPLALLKKAKGSVSLDPGSTISEYTLEELTPCLKKVKVFFPNEEEAKKITGKNYKRAAQDLLRAGIEIVVIKRGKKGAYLATKQESFKIKNLDYPVTDTTGAGDAFASAFISAWLKKNSLREACKWGVISSNICVTKLGAQNSATLEEIRQVNDFKCC